MKNPRLEHMEPPEGIIPKPGTKELANHLIQCVNAALELDDHLEMMEVDPIGVTARFEKELKNLKSLNDMTGPLLAEVNDPLETVMFIFGGINQSLVDGFVSQIARHALSGVNPQHIQAAEDHCITIVCQVMFDIVKTHLGVIGWTGAVTNG